jgi:hypothetical protein
MSNPQPTPPAEAHKVRRDLTLHELCKIIPPHSTKEAEELLEDIRQNKLQFPVKTFHGQILDGRGRYNACVELDEKGVDTNFRTDLNRPGLIGGSNS